MLCAKRTTGLDEKEEIDAPYLAWMIAATARLIAMLRYEASRERQKHDGSLVAARPLDLGAGRLGEAFDQPAADPGIRASKSGGSTARKATAPAHLVMTGLILDSKNKNMILPEDPAISPAGLPECTPVGMCCR
jgi:hypothetical protein